MVSDELVTEFIDSLLHIENEMKLLREDRVKLFDDFKSRLDTKAMKAAIQIAKIRSKLGDSEAPMDAILDVVSKKICL